MYLYTPIFKIFGRFLPQFQLENKIFWLFFLVFGQSFMFIFNFFIFWPQFRFKKKINIFYHFYANFGLQNQILLIPLGIAPISALKIKFFAPILAIGFLPIFLP